MTVDAAGNALPSPQGRIQLDYDPACCILPISVERGVVTEAAFAQAGVIVDYKGITVEEDTALRRECRENGIDYAVVKNTLLRFAFNNTGL